MFESTQSLQKLGKPLSQHIEHPQSYSEPFIGMVIDDRYRLTKLIGRGTFSSIYSCEIVGKKNKDNYVIKIERPKYSKKFLRNEWKVYMLYLNDVQGFASIYDYGAHSGFDYMVMDRLSNSVEKIFKEFNHKFTLRTVLNIAMNGLTLLEDLHKKGYVHRDVKPENFLIGPGSGIGKLYLIDFGLAYRFMSEAGDHFPSKDNKKFIGTVRYASLTAHMGRSQGRKDDLESFGYMLIYLLKGRLPWQGIKSQMRNEGKSETDIHNYIGKEKNFVNVQQLCYCSRSSAGYYYPGSVFTTYFEKIRSLRFNERPEYELYRNIFEQQEKRIMGLEARDLSDLRRMRCEDKFDWLNDKLMQRVTKTKNKNPSTSKTNGSSIDSKLANLQRYLPLPHQRQSLNSPNGSKR